MAKWAVGVRLLKGCDNNADETALLLAKERRSGLTSTCKDLHNLLPS